MAGADDTAAANSMAAIMPMAAQPVSPYRTDQRGGGAVVLHVVETKAPDDVVVGLRHVELGIAILIVAMTLAAGRLAATIAIGDQVGLVVVGIDAGADPGGCRGRRAGWALMGTAAATGAEISVHPAITPVIALGLVLGLGVHGEMGACPLAAIGLALRLRPADRQYGKGRRRRQRQAETRQQPAPRGVPGQPAHQLF